MRSSPKAYTNLKTDFNKFKELLIEHFPAFNISNTDYLNTVYSYICGIKIKGKVSFIRECSKFFKLQRNGKGGSRTSKDYWVSIGWSEDEAIKKVSELQSARSILTVGYWTNRGYSESEAKKMVAERQSYNSKKRYEKYTADEISSQSVWSKSYWMAKGYTEEEAEYEIAKRNYGKREFWNSDKEYAEIKKIIGKKTSNFIKNNPEKYKSFFGSVSKEETVFFEDLCSSIPGVNHKPFIVNVKASESLNQGIVKYDGYLKTDGGIILIEYDGLYWHNQSYDEIKDTVTLDIRNNILGIIRVSCEHYKTKPIKTIKIINHAIKEIKSKKSNRVKIY